MGSRCKRAVKILTLAGFGVFLILRYRRFWDIEHPDFTTISWDYENLFWFFQLHTAVLLRHGLPLWDHAFGCGYCLLKDIQSMAWHPVPLLAAWIGPSFASLLCWAQFSGILFLFVTALGVYAIGRAMGAPFVPTLSAALCLTLLTEGPAARFETGQWNSLAGAAVLPWLALLAIKSTKKTNWINPILVCLLLVFYLLAGPHPLNVGGIIFVLVLWVVCLRHENNRISRMRALKYGLWAASCACLLTAPVILANLQGIAGSARYTVTESLLDDLVELMRPMAILQNWLVPFSGKPPYIEGFLYAGWPLTLCGLAVIAARRSIGVFYSLGAVVFCLVYAMGNQTFFYDFFLRYLPGIAPSGLPGRYLQFVSMFLCLAPAVCFTIEREKLPSVKWYMFVSAFIIVTGFAAAGWRVERVVVPLLALLASVSAFCLLRNAKLTPRTAGIIICTAIVIDLAFPAFRLSAVRHPIGRARSEDQRARARNTNLDLLASLFHDAAAGRPDFRCITLGWNPMIPLRHLQFSSGSLSPPYQRSFNPPRALDPIVNYGGYGFAYLYPWAEAAAPEAVLNRMHAPGFNPDCLLYDSTELTSPGDMSSLSDPRERIALSPERIQLGPDKVRLRISTQSPVFIYLAMAYDGDWRAAVDGKPECLVPAYHMMTAVPIREPGDHRVHLVYRPRFMRYGRILQFLGLAWAAVGLFLMWRSRRRERISVN